MGIGHPPHNKQDRLDVLLRGADNVVPLRHRGDGFSDASSPLLEEALADEEPTRQGTCTFCRCARRMPGFGRLRSSYQTSLETSLFESGKMP
jgi:hypothetical protein